LWVVFVITLSPFHSCYRDKSRNGQTKKWQIPLEFPFFTLLLSFCLWSKGWAATQRLLTLLDATRRYLTLLNTT
jgi:hypothetical protein